MLAKEMIKSLLILTVFVLLGCKDSKKSNSNFRSSYSYQDDNDIEYSDGTYCAEIEYYNPKTGTQSTYTLQVEIEDEELVKIYWSNGGWLDESHFYAPDISDGSASFDDDRGREFEVEILNEGRCSYTSYVDEDDDDDEICPRCGLYKYSFDDYCEDCLLELEENEDDFYDY